MSQQGWFTKEARKLKGDCWVYHYYTTRPSDGKRVEHTTVLGALTNFPKEADAWREVERRQTLLGADDPTPGTRLTFNALARSYRDTELPQKAFTTQELHEHILNSYILARWGNATVEEVRILELKKWFLSLGEKLAKPTVQKIKAVMYRLYSYGRANELLPSSLNPLAQVSLQGIGQEGTSKPIIVSPEVAWKIAMAMPVMGRTIVLVAAGAGLRVSEILGLRWSDLDFVNNRIMLSRTWVAGQVGKGKSEASRVPVVMGSKVAQALQAWQRETPYAAPTDWVFASLKLQGKKPCSGSQFVKDYLRPLLITFGIIPADYKGRAGLHAFRHSLATVLITEEGQDPKTAQGILRHANSDVTMDIYTHAQDSVKRAALDRFESRMVN